MNDDLIERLRRLDPASEDRVRLEALDLEDLPPRVMSTEPESGRGAVRTVRRARRPVAVAIAVVLVVIGVAVPLWLLSPLGRGTSQPGGATSPTIIPTPSISPAEAPSPVPTASWAIEVLEPHPYDTVGSPFTVSGTADVFEATVSLRVIDSEGNVLTDTFTTATCGTGCRGDYSAGVAFNVDRQQPGTIVVFEASAEDGSMVNEVEIPVMLLPPGATAGMPEAVEGPWRDHQDDLVPDGTDPQDGFALVLHLLPGPEHCGWESATFLNLAWPIGSVAKGPDGYREFVRDPEGILGDRLAGSFEESAELPSDATFTGFQRGEWQLWIGASDAKEAIYLLNVSTGLVERWPRAPELILCD